MQLNNSSDLNRVLPGRLKRGWWNIYGLFQIGSIFQWTLAIFFVVTLPLIVAILYSIWSIQEYTDQGADLFLTIEVSDSSQTLVDQLRDMDRNIRKYQVLEDIDYFAEYQEHHDKFVDIATQIKFFVLPEKLEQMFFKLTSSELELYDQTLIKKNSDSESLSIEDINRYSQLRSVASEFVMQVDKQIYLQTKSLSVLATSVRKQVTQAALISVALALFLGLLLLYLINQPIKRIERVIRMLGNAQFNKRISIEGPSDIREVGKHLEWLRNKLNQLENGKQFFIKTISHELKTPLATLVEGADLLQDEVVGELNAEQHKIIELLQIANISLNGLIENLLEYQKATTTTLARLNFSLFNLNQVIDNICMDYRLLLDKKKVSIELEGKPIDLMADRDKIKIIISNLFSNALKFSPDGGQISIKLEVIGDHLNMLIADQGPGIAKEQLPHIFTEFYRQETPEDWKIKGSGLGLSLVKEYVAAHYGKIKILAPTVQYTGAQFLIILPLTPPKIRKKN